MLLKSRIYWSYCYFMVRGTVMTSGRLNPTLQFLFWELGLCGITFEFFRSAYAAR